MSASRERRSKGRSAIILAVLVFGAPAALAATPSIPFDSAEVQSPDAHSFVLTWRAEGVRRVRIYAGTDPARIRLDSPVAEGAGAGEAEVTNLPPASRWYFELVPDRGRPLIVADRSLHLTGAPNFRDAGGYRTSDGGWVRMGMVFRSNGIDRLTAADLNQLAAIHLRLVADLRTDEERQRAPDLLPPGVVERQANVMADRAGDVHALLSGDSKPGGNSPSFAPTADLTPTYRDFVDLPSARRAYHQLFEELADRRHLPTMFHCTAGKDRTGWAAAVLLTILGVPRAAVLEDFALTDRYLPEELKESLRERFPAASPETLRKMLAADPAFLEASFDETTRRFGSFDNYLREGLGLGNRELEAIRKNFLVR